MGKKVSEIAYYFNKAKTEEFLTKAKKGHQFEKFR